MTPFRILVVDLKDAWLGLRRRPFRSILSGLGIGIGVTSLVAMLSIGEGAKRTALDKVESLGIGTIRIEGKARYGHESDSKNYNLSQGLTVDDSVRISQAVSGYGQVAAFRKSEKIRLISEKELSSTVIGVSPGWQEVEKIDLLKGRPILVRDIETQGRVCLVAAPLARILQAEIGGTIAVGPTIFRVIGIFKGKGRLLTEGTGLSSLDFNNLVVTPLTSFPTASPVSGHNLVDGIVVRLKSPKESRLLFLAEQISELIKTNHRNIEDFHVVVPLNLMKEARATQKIFSLTMGAIAGLSLLVGGIGVMNIMLANINEQTREIGLRMAVGATRRRVSGLYLLQAVVLTALSGVWGLLGGVLLAWGVQAYAGWEVGYSLPGLMIGPFSAILSGVIFGMHPALRAAGISPAVALRDT